MNKKTKLISLQNFLQLLMKQNDVQLHFPNSNIMFYSNFVNGV